MQNKKKILCLVTSCFSFFTLNFTNHAQQHDNLIEANSCSVLNNGVSGLKPSALFASPIFPLSDSQEGYDISGKSNKTSFLNNNKSSLSGGATKYLSIDRVSLVSIHTVGKFIPYFGYSASREEDVTNLLIQNNNKMPLSELIRYDDLFAREPYLSFLQKTYDSERGPVKMQISGKVTLNCENDSLFDPYFTETYDFTSEFELSNVIVNDNILSIPSCFIDGIPGDFNKGTLNIFLDNPFFDNVYLEYVPLSNDESIPEHYELSCENKKITMNSASLQMYGKTSNKLQFDNGVPILPVNSTDFEFPNFYKIKIDTKNINWREFTDESGEKIKRFKAYDVFDSDSYKDINIPIDRFTFLGFDGNPLCKTDINFWLSKEKDPRKKDNLLFYPQDDSPNPSKIAYIRDSEGNVTDISVRIPYIKTLSHCFANINWIFSSAQGYSTTYVPVETNDMYDPNWYIFNNRKGLPLFLNTFNEFRWNVGVTKYSLDLKPDDLTRITGQSTISHKDAYDYDHLRDMSIEYRVDYQINIKGIHFELPYFNLDSVRKYFELYPEKAKNIFSLKDIFNLKDVFFKDLGQLKQMICNIKLDGSIDFRLSYYIDNKCVDSQKDIEHYDLNDLLISTVDPGKSCSFNKEYGSRGFLHSTTSPVFSINDYDSSNPKGNTLYEMLKFKFECNSAGDYVPKFFASDLSNNKVKIQFNINSNVKEENFRFCYTSLPTFSFSNESLTFVKEIII